MSGERGLVIAPELTLPIDFVTSTAGILAKKGSGKSNAAVRMAEEMFRVGVPWVAVDPKGDWWGMRSSADGKSPGLPLVVFGGRHGDIPLEPTAGPMLADLILANRLTCILDVSQFSKADVIRFLTAFGDRLFREAENEPLHLFLEEAHEYLPQRVMRDETRMVGVWQKIVKEGRFKGLGCTLISQRSAALNKDVLTQVDTLFVLRTMSPQDRAAVRAWVDEHAMSAQMMADLPSLENGEAWVWSPELLKQFVKIRFYRRSTFDSGETPKVGQARRPPATLADVDLAAIKEAMTDTIERAKETDPKALRKRITELERELARVPVPFVPPAVVEAVLEMRLGVIGVLDSTVEGVRAIARQNAQESAPGPAPTSGPVPKAARYSARPRADAPDRRGSRQTGADPPAEVVRAAARELPERTGLKLGARRMVEVVARYHPRVLTRDQLSTLAHVAKGGTLSEYTRSIITAGLVTETGAGIVLVDAVERWTDQGPFTSAEVVAMYAGDLKLGARRMLDLLLESYPDGLTRTELSERAEVAKGGTLSEYTRSLLKRGLAVEAGGEVFASPTLFFGGR